MTEAQIAKAEGLVKQLIELIGDDPNRDGLKDTPRRVVKSWSELYSGYNADPLEHTRTFTADYDQIIALDGIDYYSTCEHHMLPFYGKCKIAYLPNGDHKVLGVSKIARILNVYARRLQIQEQLTQQVAYAIEKTVKAKGVAVIIEGKHMCMTARGVNQQHSQMRTSCMLGVFRESASARSEALQLLKV